MEVIECKKCAGIIDIKKIKGNVCVCEFCGSSHFLSEVKTELEGTYIPDFLYYYNQMYLCIAQMEKAIKILKKQIEKTEKIEPEEYKKLYEKKYDIVSDVIGYVVAGSLGVLACALITGIILFIVHTILAVLNLFGQSETIYNRLHEGVWNIFWIGTIILGVLWVVFLVFCELSSRNNEKKLLKENETLIKENQQIEKRNEETNLKKNNLIRLYKQEEYELNVILNKAKKEKEQLDKMECIYPKYAENYIFLCSFYEYFKSGRCNKLEGADGAYNLLENDIRARVIPSRDNEESRAQMKEKNAVMKQNSKKTEIKINLFKSIVSDMPYTIASIKEYKPLYDYNNVFRQMNEECLKWRKENS